MYALTAPLQDIGFLRAGDRVELSGIIYTARCCPSAADQTH